MSRCRHHDARCVARRRLRAADDAHAFAFGTADEVVVALGARARLVLEPGEDGSARVDAFLAEHGQAWGYLGFGLHGAPTGPAPAGVLVAPLSLHRLGPGDDAPGACDCERAGHASARDLDDAPAEAWCTGAEAVLAWVREAPGRRLTLARRVELPDTLVMEDLLGLAPPDPRCRDLLLRLPGLSVCGQSPELLADGTVHGFDTWKVSGTVPLAGPPGRRAEALARLREGADLAAEHEGGVAATEAALSRLGTCARAPRDVLALSELAHLLTRLHTRPAPGTTVGRCLQAVLPTGASPAQAGLELLRRHEAAPRGPYYGLVGWVEGDGRFHFAQALRLVLRDATGTHTWAGAALTPRSTVAGELEETRTKLGAIRLPASTAPRAQPTGG
ncbi:MAG: chorismate-binding protein [Alphaproteobacteria bacterium]|nr:chorismate-binding protein [Alphaproteobacteria bacterium]